MGDVVRRQFAAAYRQPLFVGVETWSGYRSAAFDPQGPQHLLPPDASDEALGRAVLDALAHSRFFTVEELQTGDFFNYENRNRIYTAWVDKLMSAYGLKTKRALFKDLDHCEITGLDGKISIAPKHHVKLEAWEEVPGVADLKIPANSPPQEIGAALRQAFALWTKK
jgi:hypothetical protein